VKVANKYGFIDKTIPREQVWLAATPQIFQVAHYAGALQLAMEKKVSVTDDNSLMELIGQRVKLVDTGCDNFKITLPSDLARAELILRARRK
jgi:2-C-methyl-D-erythritol 4-phosphate cytidylyltransferase